MITFLFVGNSHKHEKINPYCPHFIERLGEFEKTYKFISDSAEWTIIEEDGFMGKEDIINNCEQVSSYYKSVTTDFKTLT